MLLSAYMLNPGLLPHRVRLDAEEDVIIIVFLYFFSYVKLYSITDPLTKVVVLLFGWHLSEL